MSKAFPWFGVLLILVGAALLMDKLDVLQFGFQRILWGALIVFGLGNVWQGFAMGRRGSIFFGTMAFLYGIYFFLRTIEFVEFRSNLFFPATFLILGTAFLMTYLSSIRDRGSLIAAVAFFGLGTAVLLAQERGYDFRDLWWSVRKYWPVVLILLGLGLILRNQTKGQRVIENR